MKRILKITAIGAALALLLPAGAALADPGRDNRLWTPPKHYAWVPPGHRQDHKHHNRKHYDKHHKWSEHKKQEYERWKYEQRPDYRKNYGYGYGYRQPAPVYRHPYIPELPRVILGDQYGYPSGHYR